MHKRLSCDYFIDVIDVLGQPGLGAGGKLECAGRSGSPSVGRDGTAQTNSAGRF